MSYHLLERHLYRLCGPIFNPSHQLHMRPLLSAMSVARPSLQREIAVRQCGVAWGCSVGFREKLRYFLSWKAYFGKRAEKIRLQSTPSMPCFHAFAMNDQTAFILLHVFPIFESAVWQVHVVSCCTIRPMTMAPMTTAIIPLSFACPTCFKCF